MTTEPVAESERPGLGPPVPLRWYHKLSALLFVALCLELGLFLFVYPWSPYWERNYFSALTPKWEGVWRSSYVRGAVSGIGLLDIYIFWTELYRLLRLFFKRQG